jgi:hypothetical protein
MRSAPRGAFCIRPTNINATSTPQQKNRIRTQSRALARGGGQLSWGAQGRVAA